MMRKGDLVWALLLFGLVMLFVIPIPRDAILESSAAHPYIGGFVKFAILATMGDVLGKRIVSGDYQLSSKIFWRAIVWGIIGCMVTLVFQVFMGGAGIAQAEGLLPFYEVTVAQAIFGSAIMNLTFAPAMNTFHRIMDLWIEAAYKKDNEKITLNKLVRKIDWPMFVSFNWLKVGILFWIPVHSVVFLLPGDIRVVVAAFCSIALGIILSFAAKKGDQTVASPVK